VSATNRKGFTLIELIVVIVVLGILAAIAVVGFGSVIDRSRQDAVESAARAFDREYRALLAYESGRGDFSSVDRVAVASSVKTNDVSGAGQFAVVSSDGTVTFNNNGKCAVLTLTGDPAVASQVDPCDSSAGTVAGTQYNRPMWIQFTASSATAGTLSWAPPVNSLERSTVFAEAGDADGSFLFYGTNVGAWTPESYRYGCTDYESFTEFDQSGDGWFGGGQYGSTQYADISALVDASTGVGTAAPASAGSVQDTDLWDGAGGLVSNEYRDDVVHTQTVTGSFEFTGFPTLCWVAVERPDGTYSLVADEAVYDAYADYYAEVTLTVNGLPWGDPGLAGPFFAEWGFANFVAVTANPQPYNPQNTQLTDSTAAIRLGGGTNTIFYTMPSFVEDAYECTFAEWPAVEVTDGTTSGYSATLNCVSNP
jgi:type IV pilus assembly protein PilA